MRDTAKCSAVKHIRTFLPVPLYCFTWYFITPDLINSSIFCNKSNLTTWTSEDGKVYFVAQTLLDIGSSGIGLDWFPLYFGESKTFPTFYTPRSGILLISWPSWNSVNYFLLLRFLSLLWIFASTTPHIFTLLASRPCQEICWRCHLSTPKTYPWPTAPVDQAGQRTPLSSMMKNIWFLRIHPVNKNQPPEQTDLSEIRSRQN